MLGKLFNSLENPNTTSGLDELVGTFSLNHSQLYVGTLKTDDGQVHKAVNINPASYEDGPSVGLYFFSRDDATRLVSFLNEALRGSLPVTFRFPAAANPILIGDGDAEWTISKFVDEWHHGGGYKGTLDRQGGHIITKRSAKRLRKCVSEFFGVPDAS